MTDAWGQATRKLIETTGNGTLHWRVDPALTTRRQAEFARRGLCAIRTDGPVYVAETMGKHLAVYPVRVLELEKQDPIRAHARTNVWIEFIDEEGTAEWTWPSPEGRFELLEAIQYQHCDAGEFLKQLLAV